MQEPPSRLRIDAACCSSVTVRVVRRVLAFFCAAVLAASVVTVVDAGIAEGSTRAQREQVRRKRAAAAAAIDALRAEDAEVTAALQVLNAEVTSGSQALAAAEEAFASARAAEAATAAEIATLRRSLRAMAVREYIGGASTDAGTAFPDADPAEQVRRAVLAELALGSARETADRLSAAREDFELARQRAEVERDNVRTRVAALRAARDRQAAVAARVDQRIEVRLAEAASLARLDQQLGAQLARQQAALAARNPGSRAGAGRPVSGRVPLRTVRGITVHADIADRLESLLAAAEADGLIFGGGGYRDPEDQWAVRRRNCPDPANSPPSACRPPTARPGYSMHERGLAIDFTHGGSTVRSGSPAYRWLSGNAGRYGLRNMPGEPWHWSTNGN